MHKAFKWVCIVVANTSKNFDKAVHIRDFS